MKILRIAVMVLLASAMHGYGQITLAVDMDPLTAGIQSTRPFSPGNTFTVELVLTVGAGGVSSYGFSVLFDNVELALNGSLVPTDAGSAAKESTPVMMSNFNVGVQEESNATTGMPTKGHVYTFEAFGTGPGFTGPSSTSFVIGTIAFTVSTVANDGATDIDPGVFNVGTDGVFDNAGLAVVPTFVSGSVIPEPGSVAFVTLGVVLLLAAKRYRRGR